MDNYTPEIPLKRCTKCGQEFPATREYFQKSSRNKTGIGARCIDCSREDSRERRRIWRVEHPEEARAKARDEQRLFRRLNRDRLNEKNRARGKRNRQANPERERERSRRKFKKLMETNPEQHREKSRRSNHKRRILKLENTQDEHFTKEDVRIHLKMQKGLCWWCGVKLCKYDIDHRVPLSRGGNNSAGNICLTCPSCNRQKGNKMPWEWSDRLL